jgi:hypothetical protein
MEYMVHGTPTKSDIKPPINIIFERIGDQTLPPEDIPIAASFSVFISVSFPFSSMSIQQVRLKCCTNSLDIAAHSFYFWGIIHLRSLSHETNAFGETDLDTVEQHNGNYYVGVEVSISDTLFLIEKSRKTSTIVCICPGLSMLMM